MDGPTDCGRNGLTYNSAPACWGAPSTTIDVGRLADEACIATQQQSPFFTRLPPEIRLYIYSLVMPQHRRLWVQPAAHGNEWGALEHFPCRNLPVDTTRIAVRGRCCAVTNNSFFEHVRANGIWPHQDALALMQTCQQIYHEMCRLWTFCFDDLTTLAAFAKTAGHLPVRHAQMMLYAPHGLYCGDPAAEGTRPGWRRRRDAAWERQLREVDDVCRRIPGLGTLLLSVIPTPRFIWMENEEAVVESLRAVTAAPRMRTECLRWRLREVAHVARRTPGCDIGEFG
ncbi:hypothetical protein C8A05DRAFT_16042 [Staphylotrichum tortipilum]|uniref:DUF7730 domain-containing protein n=1 Tax=Staphylotrichum tortipilum TaxID=2831512 RepID=A0AAN6RTR9_9PEZI|nr:hypothetical protein C8A05DRAFT_16042 [Staphylotrichum longicolle]